MNSLALALDALAADLPGDPDTQLKAAYVAARQRIAELSREEPLQQQAIEVSAALRAVANTAALLRGNEPLLALEGLTGVSPGHDPEALEERATRAGELVAAFAKEARWKPAGREAARALHALADAVEVAPLSLDAAAWSLLVTTARYEAVELEREDAISLDRADRIKDGLLSCIAALQHVAEPHRSPLVRALEATARDSASAIDTRRTFVFQRAIIQDALRATADAYLALALSPPPVSIDHDRSP